jgi:Zn finger protein HypA/HybF involved in hydrogenase expression
MVAKTGERAQKTGDFHCADCGATVHVQEGDRIPPCPCGKNEFASRTGEPGNKS